MITLPTPKDRRFIFNKQVTQESIGTLSKDILDVNSDDAYISDLYALHGFTYSPMPIEVFIDSYGGSVYNGFGILSIIENSKTPVHTIVTGCAMSCGFLISISGHKRYAYKTSTFLYHQASSGTYGKLKEMDDDVIEVKRLQKIIEEYTLSHTKIDRKKLKEVYDMKQDWFISAKEALSLGIIDEIL